MLQAIDDEAFMSVFSIEYTEVRLRIIMILDNALKNTNQIETSSNSWAFSIAEKSWIEAGVDQTLSK